MKRMQFQKIIILLLTAWVDNVISLERCNNIIKDQSKEGIVEKVDEICEQERAEGEKVFYFPHLPVFRESAKTTKLRIVYDTSLKPTKNSK